VTSWLRRFSAIHSRLSPDPFFDRAFLPIRRNAKSSTCLHFMPQWLTVCSPLQVPNKANLIILLPPRRLAPPIHPSALLYSELGPTYRCPSSFNPLILYRKLSSPPPTLPPPPVTYHLSAQIIAPSCHLFILPSSLALPQARGYFLFLISE